MASAEFPPIPPVPVPEPEPAPGSPPPARNNLLSWIATSNPFYVISAGLFLFGLKMSFGEQTRDADSWALMTGLGGYTLLLASAALLLVRYAKVWNDVRTILLLMVLMFLATSVTFDELLVLDPDRGVWFCAGGLVFAVAVTEAVLGGIRLNLFHLVSLLLVLGVGLNYALFFNRSVHDEAEAERNIFALLICALTTTSAFGVLSFANNPVLESIGTTVGMGAILSLIFSALWSRAGRGA